MLVLTLLSGQCHDLLAHLLVTKLIRHQVRLSRYAKGQLEALTGIKLLHLILQIVHSSFWSSSRVSGVSWSHLLLLTFLINLVLGLE